MKLVTSIQKRALFSCLLGASLSASPLLAAPTAKEKTKTAAELKKEAAEKKKNEENISVALGEEVGSQINRTLGKDLNFKAFTAAIKRALDGKKNLLSTDDKQKAMQAFQAKVQNKMKEKATATKKKGADFLATNKKKSGIKTTATGLQYKILKKGKGPLPKGDSEVSVHYEGKLLDGTVFDSSYKRNEPANFRVTQVIPGWTEALKLMPEGSEWELYIPSNLAYGERDLPTIPANSVLTFKVALLSIKKPEPKKEAQKEAQKEAKAATKKK